MAYENKGIAYLRKLLEQKKLRVNLRYTYYDMKNQATDFGISTPPHLKHWKAVLGWCGKAVDSLADRLVFREFREDNFNIDNIFRMNNPDVFFDSAVLSALISSCSFVYISADDDGFPRLQVIDGGNATGVIDPITGLLYEGYAVLSADDNGRPVTEAHFTAEATVIYHKGQPEIYRPNDVGYPLLVPLIYRPDARRPFGHSRISRACLSIMGEALRTIKRSEISAEYYSFPQKYAVGLSEGVEVDKWKASMSSMITFTKDEDGDSPKLGQFQQQSMTPHSEQLRMFASLFGAETGLTLDDLGFPSENPSSAEAIKAAHENLRLCARKAQRTFGSGFLNVGYLAACMRDKYPYQRRQLYLTTPIWEPVFEPDAAALASIGDGAIKLNQAVPGYINAQSLSDLTGIKAGE